MCEFCEDIPVIEKLETIEDELPNKNKGLSRESVALVKHNGNIRLYGFNKYQYEEDALYTNIEVNYCPMCGRKLSEETEND